MMFYVPAVSRGARFWGPMILVIALALGTSVQAFAQDSPKAEVFTGFSYLRGRDLDSNYVGLDVSAAGNINKWFGVLVDYSHHNAGGPRGHMDTLLVGPKFTSRGKGLADFYLQTSFGGTWLNRSGSSNSFAWALGGGVDLKVNRHLAVRVIDVTFMLLRVYGSNSSNGRLSTGLVWRFGGQ